MAKRKGAPKPMKQAGRAEPAVGRPIMPKTYGACGDSRKGFLAWSEVSRRLARAHNYWVGTTRPGGRPHAMPVWGLWLDEAFYFSTDRGSRKGRNLTANPALVVHLESGDDVVILEGVAREVTDRSELKRMDDAYHAKYGMRVLGMPGDVGFYSLATPGCSRLARA